MKETQISACFSPTTVILVDDNSKFLTNVCSLLDNKTTVFKTFSDPVKALHFFESEYQFSPFIDRCLLRPEESQRDHRNLEINVQAIFEEIYNPERFKQVSVLVVDYEMPGMNGLVLCQQIKNRFIKKILLTGEADERLAIDAFNKGIIQKFIRKDAANFDVVLNGSIQELQSQYFYELSEIVINSLTKNTEYPPNCLDDPVFITFFNKLCQQHKFTEYYLLDAYGSFLFLDENAKSTWLVIRDDDAMKGAVMDAELSDTEFPAAILQSLVKGEKLLFQFNEEDFRKNPSEWLPYLHVVKTLEGREIYYYSLIENSEIYNIHPKRILAYKAYKEKLL